MTEKAHQPHAPGWRDALDAANAAPRCKAKRKHGRGPCHAPAVAGWRVCRMHGAGGGAPRGKSNGRYRHGERSAAAIAERRDVRALIQAVQELTRKA